MRFFGVFRMRTIHVSLRIPAPDGVVPEIMQRSNRRIEVSKLDSVPHRGIGDFTYERPYR